MLECLPAVIHQSNLEPSVRNIICRRLHFLQCILSECVCDMCLRLERPAEDRKNLSVFIAALFSFVRTTHEIGIVYDKGVELNIKEIVSGDH